MRNAVLMGVVSLCLCLPFNLRAENVDEDTRAFLARFSKAMSGVSTVFSEFEQDRHMALLEAPLRSTGVIIFSKPNRLRWDTVTPYRSTLIADGKNVAQFEKMGDSWKKLKIGYAAAMGEVMESLSLVWGGDLAGQRKHYRLAVKDGEEPTLTLTPRDSGMRKVISAIELHFKEDLSAATRVVLKEPGGDSTVIRFVSQNINPKLPERCFNLDSPVALDQIRGVALAEDRDE
jgi:outer membrane lipoprotein-sorting protein